MYTLIKTAFFFSVTHLCVANPAIFVVVSDRTIRIAGSHWISHRPWRVTAGLVFSHKWHSFFGCIATHDDVIEWKHFPRHWPFVRGIHRSPVNSPHKGQWRRALMFTLICARINGWVNNHEAGDLRRNRAHYDAIVMYTVEDGYHTTPASCTADSRLVPANERRRYKVTPSLIGWAQT